MAGGELQAVGGAVALAIDNLQDGFAREQHQRAAQRKATAIDAAAADAAVGRALDLNAGQRGGVGADEGLGLAARLPGQPQVQRRLVSLDSEIGARSRSAAWPSS